MAGAVDGYRQFLGLAAQHQYEFLVPSLGVDLVWHAHQLYPADYEEDCKSALGRILHHRTQGSTDKELKEAFRRTQKLHRAKFDGARRHHDGTEPLGHDTSPTFYFMYSMDSHDASSKNGNSAMETALDNTSSADYRLESDGEPKSDDVSEWSDNVIDDPFAKSSWDSDSDGFGTGDSTGDCSSCGGCGGD